MRELESIVDKRDVVLCAPLLLIYAHKKCKTIGEENPVYNCCFQNDITMCSIHLAAVVLCATNTVYTVSPLQYKF